MKLRLNKNQVVCCTSLEGVEQFFNIISQIKGIKESLHNLQRLWTSYRELTYFSIKNNKVYFGNITYENIGKCISIQDFLTMHSEPFMGYFESDGTKETGRKIIAVLKALGGVNSHSCNGRNHSKKQYFIAPNNDIDLEYLYSVDGYHKCNLDHYLHLIENSGDTTAMVEIVDWIFEVEKSRESIPKNVFCNNIGRIRRFLEKETKDHTAELAELHKQLSESVERERIANNIIAEKDKEIEDNKNSINELDDMCTALNKELDAAKIKADKWDAIPQYFCMRGSEERFKEVEAEFEKRNAYIDSLNEYDFNDSRNIYYFIHTKGDLGMKEIYTANYNSCIGKLLLATQTITELPPLEEKEEVEEFWLKPLDPILWRYDETNKWEVEAFGGWDSKEYLFLPFTPETEKLIGTIDEPTKKYKFMGVKPYFNH